MLKKALPTNPRDASPAVMRERTAALSRKKCSLPHAHHAAVKREFLFSRETIVLYTAAIVSPDRDNFCLKYEREDTPYGVYLFLQGLLCVMRLVI
jgi:hypothetical protein